MTSSQRAEREVPWQPAQRTDWQFSPVKHHFDILLGKMLQPKEQSLEDVAVPYFKAQHVQWDKVLTEDLPTMWATPGEISSLRVRKGDLLVCEGGEVGRAAIVTEEPPKNCIIQNALHLVRPKQSGDVRFLRYLLQQAASHEWLSVLCNRATIAHFTAEKFNDMWIWAPPLPEQRAITDYLDQETFKIDALITEKERLLSLLTEKRRALITQAVTRGLNRDVPLRDSGVEWLGEIPGHWEISRLKMLGQVRTGIPKGRNLGNRETVTLPYLRVANVQDGYLNLSDVAKIEVLPEEAQTYRLEKGDVLMNEGGDADKLGRGTVWNGSLDPCLHQNHVFAVRCFHVESTWLATVTGSDYAKFYFESRSKQSTNLASISSTNIRELPVVMPPQEERLVIVKYLEEQISKLDDLCTIAKRAIELLQERRAALISAAVTGQIRVGVEL